jgi:hypothetical protein
MSGSMFNVQRSKLKLKRVDLLNAQTGFFYGTLKWRGNAVMNLNVHDELLILFPGESRRSINGVESTLSGGSAFPGRIFFNFSAEAYSRNVALGFESTSMLYLVLNSSEKCQTRA